MSHAPAGSYLISPRCSPNSQRTLTVNSPIISPNKPNTEPKISMTKTLTKSCGSCASASAALEPVMPTQMPQRRLQMPTVRPPQKMAKPGVRDRWGKGVLGSIYIHVVRWTIETGSP